MQGTVLVKLGTLEQRPQQSGESYKKTWEGWVSSMGAKRYRGHSPELDLHSGKICGGQRGG